MTGVDAECAQLVADLSGDDDLRRFLRPGATVHVFSAAGAPLWRSVPGTAAPDADTRQRLEALASGAAPRNGFRLEQLRFGEGDGAIQACRRVTVAGADAVLTVRLAADVADERRTGPPGRFLWHADQDGRLTFLSPAFETLIGGAAAMLGFRLADLDGSGCATIAESIAAGRGWAGAGVDWPLPNGSGRQPVELGGTPSGSGDGFRGFAVLRGAPTIAAAVASVPEELRATGTAGEPAAPRRSVPLALALDRPRAEPGPPSPAGLSVTERGALHEIARALGARLEEVGEAPAADRPSAAVLPLPPPRDLEPARLLDRLPIGIAVLRDAIPVFANRHLLRLFGADDLPGLVARGGLSGIDARTGAFPLALPGDAGALRLGELSPITWGELPATLLTVPEQGTAPLPPETARLPARLAAARAALDAAADAALTLDASGRILSLNGPGERLFAVSQNEVAGDGLAALLVPDDHRAALAVLDSARAGGESAKTAHVRSRAGGLLLLRAAYRDAEEPCFQIAFHDLSGFGGEEHALRAARRDAEQASAHQTEFLARVSHEIRTPLNAMVGFADLMLGERFGPVGNDRYKGYLRDILRSGEHVLSLVNDLLDLAKITSGRGELNPRTLDLNRIAADGVGMVAPLAARERAILRTSFSPALPPVLADERSMRQVVLNVLSNAVRYTGPGGQAIVSTAENEAGQVVLHVRDTGPGMSPDEIEAALTPMRQVVSTRRDDGTGLGLPLSKALVEANGGHFLVSSTRGRGTLVEIRMPAAMRRATTG